MANRYWVGGTGTWDNSNTTNWSTTSGGSGGASVPTSADDVFINGSSGGGTITISGSNLQCRSLDCNGFSGTLAGSSGLSIFGGIWRFSTGMTVTNAAVWFIRGLVDFYSANKTLSLSINIFVGGTFRPQQLTDIQTLYLSDASATYDNSIGYSLFCNAFSATAGAITGFGLNLYVKDFYSVDPSVTWVTSYVQVSGGSLINFYGGDKTYSTLQFFSPKNYNIYGANTYTNLQFPTVVASANVTVISFFANQTTNNITFTGASVIRRMRMQSGTPGSQVTITVNGSWSTISDIDFRDIGLNSVRSGTRLGNLGNNSNITFPAAKTVYFSRPGGLGTRGWTDTSSPWATSSGGATDINNLPLAQDTAIIDDNSGASGAATNIDSDAFALPTLDFSQRTLPFTFFIYNVAAPIYGGLINGSSVTISRTSGSLQFLGVNSATLNCNGVSFDSALPVNINKNSGTLTLGGTLLSSGTGAAAFGITSGTLACSVYGATLASFQATGGTINFGTGNTWTITDSGSAWTTSGITTSGASTITMTSASAKTFATGGSSYSALTLNQGGAGALSITGASTFANITSTYTATGATTITLPASTTTNVTNFTASGTIGKLLTLDSSSAGTRATLRKTSGAVNVSYMSIKDSNATGGATFTATNSTNAGNNVGWSFGGATGNFLMFFM